MSPPVAPPPRRAVPARVRRRAPLRLYLVGLVALFSLVAILSVVVGRVQALDDARAQAIQDGGFGAALAASSIRVSLDQAQSATSRAAATAQSVENLESSTTCSLPFSSAGVFASGHTDIVRADGTVVCSSLAAPPDSYQGAGWLPAVLRNAGITGPLPDPVSRRPSLLVSAPIGTGGAATTFVDLESLGPALASRYSGPRALEFIVTAGDISLTRSIDPAAWAGRPLASTGFDPADVTEQADVDGVDRFYGHARVAGLDWIVHAGGTRVDALDEANRRAARSLAVTGLGLLLLLAAAAVLHRHITKPIRRLADAVRHAANHTAGEPLDVAGPREIVSLGEDFRTLLATADRELATAARLATIVESSPDAIVSCDLDGTITTWNPGAERVYGYPASEAIGNNLTMLDPPGAEGVHTGLFELVARGETVEPLEVRCRRGDGTYVEVSKGYAPLRGADGSVVGVSTIARDISAQKAAALERTALERRLHQSERLESLGQLAGGIAHDFNNLLSVIINYAHFAADSLDPDHPARADIAEITAAGERAARLTRQLLTFGRRDGGISVEPLQVEKIVDDVQALLVRSIGEHIELAVHNETLPPVRIDRSQLEQILLNLAVNARDAMPDGGRLTIGTRTVVLDADYCRTRPEIQPGTYVEVAVSDTGTGMSHDVAARAFEPFFTTKRAGEGTGLGLATIYGIVTQAGGTAMIYSEVGLGTTVRVLLPASADWQPAEAEAPAARDPSGHGETVLVVEDDRSVMELTTRMLERNGYQVVGAVNSSEAYTLAQQNPQIQLLLTDSVMPQMSGRALAARILESRPELSVLYMSGYAHVVGSAAGPDADLVQKPFTESELLRKVATALDRDASARGQAR